MQCPNDQATLLMTERQGIEIDYCPTCRGVWLDKGELDKLIAGSETGSMPAQAQAAQPYYDKPQQQSYKKHKKESFIGDLFDF